MAHKIHPNAVEQTMRKRKENRQLALPTCTLVHGYLMRDSNWHWGVILSKNCN